ncbi:MAG: hypothetical protein WD200_03710 [Candidatus Andersenbacteria bacterium]
MLIAIVLLGVASLLASGVLFTHRRALTYLGVAGALWQTGWLTLTLLDRTILQSISTPTVFVAGSAVLLVAFGSFYKRWHLPYGNGVGSGKRDAWVLLPLGLVIAGAVLIAQHNGFKDNKWITHGFYNGDTATLMALTQRSFSTAGLVNENPFAANGYLEYPTLLHAGLATFLDAVHVGANWFHFMPFMTYIQLVVLIPLFFLLWDIVMIEPNRERWVGVPSAWMIYALQSLIVIYVLAVSWDGYVYPQSHFFITSIFILQTALLRVGYGLKKKAQTIYVLTALAAGVALLFSNAVTGTAAITLLLVFAGLRVTDKGRLLAERQVFLVGGIILAGLYLVATPGDAQFSLPGISYIGAFDMLRLSIVVVPLIVAVFQQLSREPFLGASASFLILLSFITFFFSGREIVVGNASRFFYHGLLIGFPLVLGLIIQLFFYVKRELMYSTKNIGEKAAGFAAVAAVLLLVALPAGGSVASTYDNLIFKDEQVIATSMREALWWIEDNTVRDAVFITSEQPPFAVPAFTGRAMLRADFWLSPNDEIYSMLLMAREGDKETQAALLSEADYLLITQETSAVWQETVDTLNSEPVFTNGPVAIYALR